MRGPGQIAELAAIAEPDVGVIMNVGAGPPRAARLDRGVAAAKAELIRDLRPGGTASCPPASRCWTPHLRDDLTTVTFGPGGDVDALPDGLELPFTSAHMLPQRARRAGRGCARARRRARRARGGRAARDLRGQRIELAGGDHRRQRLLQRQPDVDARRPRRPRRVRGRPPRRRARRHARARARRASLPRRDRRARPRRRGRRARHRRAAGARTSPTATARRSPRRDAGGGRRAGPRARSSPATPCWSRRSRGVGLEVVAQALGRRVMGEVLIAGTAALLICIFLSPQVHRVPARPRVRPAHPRGGAGGPPREGGHADDGRDHHLPGDRGAVPDPQRLRLARRWACSARPSRARCSASPTTTRRSSGAARSACAARTKLLVTIAISLGLWWVATQRAGLSDTLRLRVVDATDRPRRLLPGAHLPGRRGDDERRQPHRRPRRPRRRLRGDRAARLHRHHVHHQRPARPRAAVRLPGRRVRRLPVVQRVPGDDLHGRHRLARAGRRDRGPRRDDEDRGSCSSCSAASSSSRRSACSSRSSPSRRSASACSSWRRSTTTSS